MHYQTIEMPDHNMCKEVMMEYNLTKTIASVNVTVYSTVDQQQPVLSHNMPWLLCCLSTSSIKVFIRTLGMVSSYNRPRCFVALSKVGSMVDLFLGMIKEHFETSHNAVYTKKKYL